MIPDLKRDHGDWLGRHAGNSQPAEASLYDQLRQAGFQPIELWMIDFARPDEEMPSLEESTDDLKFFICAVMRYTGADRVQLLAHGTGCILARLTIQKYHIAHWIESEAYIAGPFHGIADPPPADAVWQGHPNAWWLRRGSTLLREITLQGEAPVYRHPWTGRSFKLDALTLRNGTADGDPVFRSDPDSPCLMGARNVALPQLGHDALRCDPAAAAVLIPFLFRPARPYAAAEDGDADGFRGARYGGPDFDDANPTIYPGAEEIPGDGIDQDGNGCDLAIRRGRDGETELPPARIRRE